MAMAKEQRKNLRVVFGGMGLPVGSVIPGDHFKDRPERHIEIGAFTETDEPVTLDLPPAVPTMTTAHAALATAQAEVDKVEFESFKKQAEDFVSEANEKSTALASENFALKERVKGLEGELEKASDTAKTHDQVVVNYKAIIEQMKIDHANKLNEVVDGGSVEPSTKPKKPK
jgi:hypothetical protein